MTSLYLLGRNVWAGAAPSPLIVSTKVGPNIVVSLLARRMRYLRFRSNSVTEIGVSHATPSKFWARSILALKERHVIGRKCVINNVWEIGRKKRTSCQLLWTARARSRRVSKARK